MRAISHVYAVNLSKTLGPSWEHFLCGKVTRGCWEHSVLPTPAWGGSSGSPPVSLGLRPAPCAWAAQSASCTQQPDCEPGGFPQASQAI